MSVDYSKRLMTWPYCDLRDVMASLWAMRWQSSQISCKCQWLDSLWEPWYHGLMYIFSSFPNPLFFLRRPTYLPTFLTAATNFLPVLVGGGWCLNHGPLAHPCLRCCSRFFRQNDHLFCHRILCCFRGAVPLSFFDRVPCYCPSVPHRIPDLRRRQTFASQIDPWPPWLPWCTVSPSLDCFLA